MSSTPVTPAADAVGAVAQSKNTYRKYVKFGTTDDGAGNISRTVTKFSILGDTDKKEPEKLKDGTPNPYAGVSTSWADAERDGFELFNENDIIGYSVKSWDGAEFLTPDSALRLYIYNRGLATFQTSITNALMKATKEDNALEAEFNGVTVDLRVGTDEEGSYSINKAPAKRAVDPEDKLIKNLRAVGASEEKIAAILAIVRAANAAAPAQTEETEEAEVA